MVEPPEGTTTAGETGACSPDVRPAGVAALPADVIVAIDSEWSDPGAQTSISSALAAVEPQWATDDVNLALVSRPLYHLPLHDPACDDCALACGSRSVHAWYEDAEPAPLGVTEPLRQFSAQGRADCILRDPMAATRQYVVFANRDPAGEADEYEQFALQIAASVRARHHVAHAAAGCAGGAGGGSSFVRTSIDSGGRSIDFCADDLEDFLLEAGRPRLPCRWEAPNEAFDQVQVRHVASDETFPMTSVAPGECGGDQELEFYLEDSTIVLCSVACEWVQSVPAADYELAYASLCAG